MGAQATSPLYTLRLLLTSSTSSNGQGHEGNESDGCHEGDEGHEEKVCEQDRKGPHGQSHGVPRVQGEDSWWLDRLCLDEEQVRQDREQEEICHFQEKHLDDCCPEGKEGTETQGLRRNQEGLRTLQEGQGVLLKMLVTASAQGVGISTPFERSSPDRIEVVEHR